ncbi:hypothetical protein V8D89_010663 [Ganoderma adspersum]
MLWTEFISILKLNEDATVKRIGMFGLLPHMALHADTCARIDFLSPVVLRVAYWLSTFHPRYGVDARTLPMLAEHAYLPSLWRVYDDYVQKQTVEELKRLAKVSKPPNMYRCAADGCGIQAIDRPPSVSSKYTCKSSARGITPIVEDDGDPDWIDIETYNPHYDDTRLREDGFYANKKGAEIFIDVPNASPYREGEVVI